MTKIEELIEGIKNSQTDGWLVHQDFVDYKIEEIMKEYAEWYANQMRDAILDSISYDDTNDIFYISEQSILNVKLPIHV